MKTGIRAIITHPLAWLALAVFLPVLDLILPSALRFADTFRTIFVFAILGLGLNIITGQTGLLNLGCAAFMAIGAYAYSILTCSIFPFQIGFWPGIAAAVVSGLLVGILLGIPVLRLRGDYIAIVTLGFGEIVQDTLRNVESITKGTQGINPVPPPSLFFCTFNSSAYLPWYYLFLAILVSLVILNTNLERSRFGRKLLALREDELAARCTGIKVVKVKLYAFALGSAFCALSGALWVSYLGTSGEPGNYDFQLSVIALCIVIVGGLGSTKGVIVGAIVMLGFNSIVLNKLSSLLASSSTNVFLSPANWKYLIFGLVLVLMMRFRPQGIIPAESALHTKEEDPA